MQFNLELYEGTDSIKFGMTSKEIQAILNISPTLFKKSEFDLFDTENYKDICHIFYEMGGNNTLICAEIEFFRPSQVFLDNLPILGEPKNKIESFFINKFDDYSTDNNRSINYEIGFYAPTYPGKKSVVESVSISRKGFSKQQQDFYEKAYNEKNSQNTTKEYECTKCGYVKKSESPLNICPKCNLIMLFR